MARTKAVFNAATKETTIVPFTPEEEAERDAEEAAAAAYGTQEPDRAANQIAENKYLGTIAEVLWQIAKAAKTGNWSAFVIDDGAGGTKAVASKADFQQYLKETFVRFNS